MRSAAWFLLLGLWPFPVAVVADEAREAPRAPIQLSVDATEVARGIVHARLQIPVAGGSLTLLYPEWIPGEHSPSGPIVDLVGIRVTAGGAPVAWHRDPLDMYAIRCDVPAGSRSLDVALDYLDSHGGRFTAGRSASDRLAVLSWNTVLLYPRGTRADALTYTARLRLPTGWDWATVLPEVSRVSNEVTFKPVSLVRLIDSPVLMGAHVRAIDLGTSPEPHAIALAGDGPEALALKDEWRQGLARLAEESQALFGWRPYTRYLWLLSLSGHTAHFGLEHHECSDNRMSERTLRDDKGRRDFGSLLAHEHVHTWCGKTRRPAGLVRSDYNQAADTSLLWTYEGLTTYLGQVLAARSGLVKPEESRDALASNAAMLDVEAGRRWRPLADTAVAAQLLFLAPRAGSAWRRSVDFYPEGALIWLEADVIIRRATKGQRSLDDFCRRLLRGPRPPYEVSAFSYDDVVAALEATAGHDWRGFLAARLERPSEHAPLGGIAGGGWKLAFDETPNVAIQDDEREGHLIKEIHSIGVWIKKGGVLGDVVPGMPAAKAGLGPGMTIVAVNGRRYTPEVLRDAIKGTKDGSSRITILAENADFLDSHVIEYAGGLRYPHLVREEGQPDLLAQILAARAPGAR